MRSLLLLSASIALCFCVPIKNETKTNYRLPQDLKPIRYVVTLETLLSDTVTELPFNGSLIMDFEAMASTNFITLHATNLTIDESSLELVNQDGDLLQIINTKSDLETDFYIIQLADPLVANQVYNLTINQYTGELTYGKNGFDLAKYKDETGWKNFILTQFESTAARRAFPCMDEPQFKASFVIRIIRPEDYFTLSNASPDEIGIDLGNGKFMDTFQATPKMPSYNVGFFISNFQNISKGNQRFFASPNTIKDLEGALNTAVDGLQALENYFNVSYGLEKIDHIAVNDDYFWPTGMENWGMIVYKESAVSPFTSRLKLVETIVHELTHQWFGDLVTMRWWDMGWLKEGFASYFSFFIGSKIRPDLNLMDVMINNKFNAFNFEEFDDDTVGPMTMEGDAPGKGPPAYIPYFKAPAIVDMMSHFLTPEIFQKCMQRYLIKFKYSSVVSKDLYDTCSEVLTEENKESLLGNHTLHEIMETWEYGIGFPIVTISMDYETGKLSISQQRYLEDSNATFNTLWHIPISLQFNAKGDTFEDTKPDLWLSQQNITLSDQTFPTDNWYVANKQFSGYFRINYDETNWKRLMHAMNSEDYKKIHKYNRFQMIQDAFTLSSKDILSIDIPIKLALHLRHEVSTDGMSFFITQMTPIKYFMSKSDKFELFQKYILYILSPTIEKVGYKPKVDEHPSNSHLRESIVQMLCALDIEECIQKATSMYHEWKEGSLELNGSYNRVILCAAMKSANTSDWDYLYNKYLNNSTAEYTLLVPLSCAENEDNIRKFLNNIYFSNVSIPDSVLVMIHHRLLHSLSPALPIFVDYLQQYLPTIKKTDFAGSRQRQNFGIGFLAHNCVQPDDCQKIISLSKEFRSGKGLKYIEENKKYKEKYGDTIINTLQELSCSNYTLQ